MSRIRLFAVSVLAIFAVSALGSASAFAGEYHGFAKSPENITGTGGEAILESTIAGAKVIITCEKVKGTGTLETTGAGKGELTYETCKLINTTAAHAEEALAVCTVANPVAKVSATLGTGNTLELLKATGANFTEIKITGASCAAKGTFAVTGEITCSGPRGFIAKVTHLLNCNSANSTLKLGAEAARLTGVLEVSDESKNLWYGE